MISLSLVEEFRHGKAMPPQVTINPPFDSLWLLGDPVLDKWLRCDRDDSRGPTDLELLLGVAAPARPVVYVQFMGRQLADVIWTSGVSAILISTRLKSILETAQLTGWTTYPVRVVDAEGKDIVGYWGLSILSHSGPIDWSKSEDVIVPAPTSTGSEMPGKKGLYFDPITWDGADFFIPRDSRYLIVTKRVSALLKKEKVTNIELEPIGEHINES